MRFNRQVCKQPKMVKNRGVINIGTSKQFIIFILFLVDLGGNSKQTCKNSIFNSPNISILSATEQNLLNSESHS